MKEAIFNTELINSVILAGGWAHKIDDLPIGATQGLRFVRPKPCDILGGYKSKFFAIESKQMKRPGDFVIRDQMRPSQITALTAMVGAKLSAFVFVNVRIDSNACLIYPWADIMNRSRIPWETLQEHLELALIAVPMPTGRIKSGWGGPIAETKTLFDLKPFLEALLTQ